MQNSNQLEQKDINTIIEFLLKRSPATKFLGWAIGGSRQVGYTSKASDFDLAFLTLDNTEDFSNRYSIYNQEKKQLIEILSFDLTSLPQITLTDLLGYRGETFYWMLTQQTNLVDSQHKVLIDAFLSLLNKYKFFWIHCCLSGYLPIIKNIKSNLEKNNLSKISKTNLKKLYRLCYIYTMEVDSNTLSKQLLLKLKNNQLHLISPTEFNFAFMAVDRLTQKYFIESAETEITLLNKFKQESNLLWK